MLVNTTTTKAKLINAKLADMHAYIYKLFCQKHGNIYVSKDLK